jgi:uncharacterized membrane protein YccC
MKGKSYLILMLGTVHGNLAAALYKHFNGNNLKQIISILISFTIFYFIADLVNGRENA